MRRAWGAEVGRQSEWNQWRALAAGLGHVCGGRFAAGAVLFSWFFSFAAVWLADVSV